MQGITSDDLQGDMQELAELLGVDQVLELCQLFGGDNLYIPISGECVNDDIKELQEILGAKNYKALQMRYCGTVIYFPMQQTVLREFVAKKVREEYDGTNRRRLMRKYNLTKNSFYRILDGKDGPKKAVKEDENQMTLFDFLR